MSTYTAEREKYLLSNKTDIAKLVKKLIVFDKLIKLLVDWKKQTNKQSEEEVLKDLTFIPLMKCLYIVCLLSIHKNSPLGLFSVFDEFKAYQYGPVDEDCYYRIDELPDYQIDKDNEVITKREGDGKKDFIGRFGLTESYYEEIMTNLDETFEMLKRAVDDLKKALYFPSFKEKNTLIDLTHRELWEKAYEKNPDNHDKLDLTDTFALFKEARGIRGVIAA